MMQSRSGGMDPVRPNLFVAVPLPAGLKQLLYGMAVTAREDLPFRKWVHQEDYHITVKFLGGQAPDMVEPIRKGMEPVARESAPFRLTLEGPGTFGRKETPRILWMGIGGERDALAALQKRTEQALAALGFEPEARPYAPHITIAKNWTGSGPADHRRLQPLLSPGHDPEQLQWTVEELVLYRTHPGKQPMYECVDRYPLGR